MAEATATNKSSQLESAGPRPNLVSRLELDRLLAVAVSTCAAILGAVGLVVPLGWSLHNQTLMTILPGRVAMKPNTAVGFCVASAALLLTQGSSPTARRWLRVLALVLGLLGALTLAEYFFAIDLRLDEWLFRDPFQQPYPGRMAPLTAVNLCIAALALFFVRGGALARTFALFFVVLLAWTSFVAIVGCMYGVPLFYGAIGYRSMALHTGIAFLVLSVGLLAADPRSSLVRVLGAKEAGGWLARRLVPAGIVLPVLLGWLYLRPGVDFGHPRFSVALLAVTLVGTGSLSSLILAAYQNRIEREKTDTGRQREEIADALRQRDRDLRLVTDHLPTLLSYIDADGRFLRVNQTYEQWLGTAANDLVGRRVREVLGDSYWERTRQAREAATSGRPSTIETAYPTVRGERQAQITYAADLDPSGQLRGFACMVQDVDEQRRAEAALRQSEKLAVVGRMASSIAHEINNPLESVTNLLYLARTSDQIGEVWEYLDTAERELRRVSAITNQTLRFHKQLTSPTFMSCSELIDGVLAVYQGRLLNSSITVERRKRTSRPVKCFEGEIRQVLSNLISNAIDSMQTDGGRLFLRSRETTIWRTGSRGMMITVADTGTGMTPETLAKIREPFFTTKGIAGNGLGLWISQEIVNRHHGKLFIRSSRRPGSHGTLFALMLPFDAIERPAPQAAEKSSVLGVAALPVASYGTSYSQHT